MGTIINDLRGSPHDIEMRKKWLPVSINLQRNLMLVAISTESDAIEIDRCNSFTNWLEQDCEWFLDKFVHYQEWLSARDKEAFELPIYKSTKANTQLTYFLKICFQSPRFKKCFISNYSHKFDELPLEQQAQCPRCPITLEEHSGKHMVILLKEDGPQGKINGIYSLDALIAAIIVKNSTNPLTRGHMVFVKNDKR